MRLLENIANSSGNPAFLSKRWKISNYITKPQKKKRCLGYILKIAFTYDYTL